MKRQQQWQQPFGLNYPLIHSYLPSHTHTHTPCENCAEKMRSVCWKKREQTVLFCFPFNEFEMCLLSQPPPPPPTIQLHPLSNTKLPSASYPCGKKLNAIQCVNWLHILTLTNISLCVYIWSCAKTTGQSKIDWVRKRQRRLKIIGRKK